MSRKNVVQKKSSTRKTPAYKGYSNYIPKEASPRPSAYRSSSSHSQGRKSGISSSQAIVYDPGSTNSILPREYYTKLRTTYSGIIPVAAFTAGPGEGDLTLPIFMCCNDVLTPFGNGTVPGGTYPGWVNGANPFIWMGYGALTTPTTLSSTNVYRLWNKYLYSSVLVTGWELEISLDPSLATTANDALLLTMTPTFDLGISAPDTVTAALAQPYTKHQIIRGAGNEPKPCTLYVETAPFLGFTKEEFKGDVALNYSCNINAISYATGPPTIKIFTAININMVDCTSPTYVVPFTVKLVQYVKFFGDTLADTN